MKIEEIQKFVEENKDKLPLSYNELVYKQNEQIIKSGKTVYSEKYKDSNYSLFKFYKPISRIK
ncbi:MAG: hypothetical protein ACRDEC_09885 [Flavobacterium sp.]